MTDEDYIPPHPLPLPPNYMPSNSTALGALGGAGFTPLLVWALSAYTHVTMPPEVAASLGAVLGNFIGYFFSGGRRL